MNQHEFLYKILTLDKGMAYEFPIPQRDIQSLIDVTKRLLKSRAVEYTFVNKQHGQITITRI